jgi:hypothetical protein
MSVEVGSWRQWHLGLVCTKLVASKMRLAFMTPRVAAA